MFTEILQPTHLIIILVVALLVLGPKRLPGVGRSLGQGLHEFRTSIGGAAHYGPAGRGHEEPAAEVLDQPGSREDTPN